METFEICFNHAICKHLKSQAGKGLFFDREESTKLEGTRCGEWGEQECDRTVDQRMFYSEVSLFFGVICWLWLRTGLSPTTPCGKVWLTSILF